MVSGLTWGVWRFTRLRQTFDMPGYQGFAPRCASIRVGPACASLLLRVAILLAVVSGVVTEAQLNKWSYLRARLLRRCRAQVTRDGERA